MLIARQLQRLVPEGCDSAVKKNMLQAGWKLRCRHADVGLQTDIPRISRSERIWSICLPGVVQRGLQHETHAVCGCCWLLKASLLPSLRLLEKREMSYPWSWSANREREREKQRGIPAVSLNFVFKKKKVDSKVFFRIRQKAFPLSWFTLHTFRTQEMWLMSIKCPRDYNSALCSNYCSH